MCRGPVNKTVEMEGKLASETSTLTVWIGPKRKIEDAEFVIVYVLPAPSVGHKKLGTDYFNTSSASSRSHSDIQN
jgi:hypothetical protein